MSAATLHPRQLRAIRHEKELNCRAVLREILQELQRPAPGAQYLSVAGAALLALAHDLRKQSPTRTAELAGDGLHVTAVAVSALAAVLVLQDAVRQYDRVPYVDLEHTGRQLWRESVDSIRAAQDRLQLWANSDPDAEVTHA